MWGIIDLADEVTVSKWILHRGISWVLQPPIETRRPIWCNVPEFLIDGSIAPGRGTDKINNP